MKQLLRFLLFLLLLLALPFAPVAAQTLSQQVLQLLSRTNSWIGTNTFYDLRIPVAAVPVDTSQRLYTDISANLYYNGALIAGSGGVTNPHNLLSTTHPDTLPASPTRAAIIVGNSTPVWARLQPGVSGCFVQYNGTDTICATSGATLTALSAAQLTGALPAISGASLTSLNASNLSSGTVPIARLSGITNTQIDGAAAIAYGKLALTGSVTNTDINATAAIAYSKLSLTNSLVAGDLTAGSVTMAKINQSGATTNQVIQWNGSAWVPASLAAGGTVTSVGLSLPAIFSVSGSPVTSSGSFSVSLASQSANTFWAAPNGSGGAPTFRTFVNNDLPTSGVGAGTYPSVTVNDRGIVTAATSTVNLATQTTGTLPAARGGLGITTVTDDTTIVANGAAWVSTAVPNCSRFWAYDNSTNLFACNTVWAAGTITASTPLSITASWNNAGVNFNQFLVNVTDSASTTISTLADLQVGGVSKWAVRKDGSVQITARRVISTSTPGITAGFGTSPAITGTDSTFTVTQGTPVGTTGTVTFGTAFTNAPVCVGVDETTIAGNPIVLTPTTTTVAVASGGTMVAADKISVVCLGK